MHSLSIGLIAIVAALHFYFLVLEMFFWTRPKGMKVFGHNAKFAAKTKVLAANQGLYNGFLSAGLLWTLLHPSSEFSYQLALFFLSCVLIAGVYGAFTASRKILFVQALPAGLALASVFLL